MIHVLPNQAVLQITCTFTLVKNHVGNKLYGCSVAKQFT